MNTYKKKTKIQTVTVFLIKTSLYPSGEKKSNDFKKQVKKHSNIHKTKAEKDLVLHRYPIS